MEHCFALVQPASPSFPPTSESPYPTSAHVVLLYLVSLLFRDLALSGDLSTSLVESILSLTSKWQHVCVIIDLLFNLLLNPRKLPCSSLADLCAVLAALLCLPTVTLCEHDIEDVILRLAQELSCKMARLPSVKSKTDFILLVPCHHLRERVVSIHLNSEFLLPHFCAPGFKQGFSLHPEHVSFELIANSQLCRRPYHQDHSHHDLSILLSLQIQLLHSHCLTYLGSSFLHPNTSHWSTSPSVLAAQMQSVALRIKSLQKQLSEDDAILHDLTLPHCWFSLQLLELISSLSGP